MGTFDDDPGIRPSVRRMIVIEKWRKGEPTSSQKTEEQSGAVTQVAQ